MNDVQETGLFDLTRTEEQRMSEDVMQRFARMEMSSIARAADEKGSIPGEFTEKAAQLGLEILQIPEALGGAGLPRSPISNALNMEDLSGGDLALALGMVMPLSFVNTVLDQGTESQKEEYLPLFCTGSYRGATTAFMEPRATFDPFHLQCTARRSDGGYVLNGSKCMVPLGLDADIVLVICDLENEGPAAFLVQGSPEGMNRTEESHMGLRSLQFATIELSDVSVTSEALLGGTVFDLKRFRALSRIGICALAVGACQGVLNYVKEYVNEREAFGEPISNRQSVAFMVADMATELEAMRLMTWRAASQIEQGLDCSKQAYLAKLACNEHAMKIGSDGVQLLGGHGFCREHPVEMWYRNLRAVAILDGVASA